jgi:hypothetical protein
MKAIPSLLLVLVLATPLMAIAEVPAADQAKEVASKKVAPGTVRKKLKFRDRGPVCMCVGGLTEEDIKAGRVPRTADDHKGGQHP